MGRNIKDVIEEIKSVSANEDLHAELTRISNNATFKAPELMYELWDEMHLLLLNVYINPFTSDEALEVFAIFTTKTKEELLAMKS
ncbi:gp291 [Bacillus phage G]|uniref:Gp291 n=1 Tax=Bacillus phage G TaxID=2884420 RepID=G3MA32_9CAUD|nr:gp291 [Bacillus phage G]AEO93550.1 gp291 [Bacillus phage G]